MPRSRPRAEPLRDIENLLTEYLVISGRGTYKCDCCDTAFDSVGWLLDPTTLVVIPLAEAWKRDDVRAFYGSRVCDAVRVEAGLDWEYKPGGWSGWACPRCTEKIRREWIVMPGEPGDGGGEVLDA